MRAKVNQNISLSDYKDVWVLAEQREGEIASVTIELIGEGRKLADCLGRALVVVVNGYQMEREAEKLLHYGVDRVLYVESPLLKYFSTDGYVKVFADLIRARKPEIVLVGATSLGRDIGPRLAARLGTGLTADCTKLEIDADDPAGFWRKSYGHYRVSEKSPSDVHSPPWGNGKSGISGRDFRRGRENRTGTGGSRYPHPSGNDHSG